MPNNIILSDTSKTLVEQDAPFFIYIIYIFQRRLPHGYNNKENRNKENHNR